MTHRQGKCDRCLIAFEWTINVPLARQTCANCYQPLTRTTRHCSFSWFTWEGFQPSGPVTAPAPKEAALAH